MRVTGIIRRVDDLGRIALPKEIRRLMQIHENTALEIYTEDQDKIILKKYDYTGEIETGITSLKSLIIANGDLPGDLSTQLNAKVNEMSDILKGWKTKI